MSTRRAIHEFIPFAPIVAYAIKNAQYKEDRYVVDIEDLVEYLATLADCTKEETETLALHTHSLLAQTDCTKTRRTR